jgi:hypothetical protein
LPEELKRQADPLPLWRAVVQAYEKIGKGKESLKKWPRDRWFTPTKEGFFQGTGRGEILSAWCKATGCKEADFPWMGFFIDQLVFQADKRYEAEHEK